MSQTLYRFWNTDGELLYVGISVRPWDRWKQHAGEKPWWEEVARVTLEPFGTSEEVRAAELEAIKSENPRYNIADMPREVASVDDLECMPCHWGDGEVGCTCDWHGLADHYADHIIARALGERFSTSRHLRKPTAVRRPSVKFVKDCWPETMHGLLPRSWKKYALDWLDDGATRADIREAMQAAQDAWWYDRTEKPWNYAGGVVRRLVRERSEGA